MESATPLRRRPGQERSRATVDRLLDAAASILERGGLPAFNTNAVAARAGVAVPALYRYFRDKEALLTALAERFLEAERDWTAGLAGLSDPRLPFEEIVRDLVRAYARAADAHPAIAPLRAAMRALPALAAVEERSLQATTQRLDAVLACRMPDVPPARRRTAARLVVETLCNGIDRSRAFPAAGRRSWELLTAGHPSDHGATFPEAAYLKAIFFQADREPDPTQLRQWNLGAA